MNTEQICKGMPKVELHAHLNGCISDDTLRKLSGEEGKGLNTEHQYLHSDIAEKPNRSLVECFDLFKRIHEVIRTPKILYSVTCEVIRDFAKENVVYLELRTTPKRIHDICSKDIYLESVVQAILDCEKDENSILVKLLISIDRKMGAVDGEENVMLAKRFSEKYGSIVVGMDLSGDPTKGSCEWILPLLEKARSCNLPISVHLPEVKQLEETKRLLKFCPNRMGHGVFLHPTLGGTQELWEMTRKSLIPIEACISSNLISGITDTLEKHYVTLLHADTMPFVICTDDSGVFNTTLTGEYLKFLKIVTISEKELRDLCVKSIEYSFGTELEKQNIKCIILKWWAENVQHIA